MPTSFQSFVQYLLANPDAADELKPTIIAAVSGGPEESAQALNAINALYEFTDEDLYGFGIGDGDRTWANRCNNPRTIQTAATVIMFVTVMEPPQEPQLAALAAGAKAGPKKKAPRRKISSAGKKTRPRKNSRPRKKPRR